LIHTLFKENHVAVTFARKTAAVQEVFSLILAISKEELILFGWVSVI